MMKRGGEKEKEREREREGWECGGCGKEERWLLHNIRHRAAYRRMCTNCVLKNHPGLFCPYCFHLYSPPDSLLSPPPPPPPPPTTTTTTTRNPSSTLTCLKCPSVAHSACVPLSSSSSPFLCPSCSSSPFLFFNPTPTPNQPSFRTLDKHSARALVAAANIAAISMSKAAALARVEAERRVKEAALAKKRAHDALEKLASLSPPNAPLLLSSSVADNNSGASATRRPRPDAPSHVRNGSLNPTPDAPPS